MTKRELQEMYWAKKNINKLEEKLAELESQATRITTQMSHDLPSASVTQDKVANIVCKIVDMQGEINYELKKLYEAERKAESVIMSLPEREAYLIRLRYICLMSWERICVEMNYSWRQVHYIHSEALKLLSA